MTGRHARARMRRLLWRWRWRIAVPASLTVALSATVLGYASTVPLPDEPVGPQASTLYYRDGRTVLARVGITDRSDVALARVPLAVRHAVLAAEDRRFYAEPAVSPRGLLRALWTDLFGGGSEGASTITQQYVRNAYLTQDRSLGRKAKEMVLAFKVEQRYTKDEILQRYLDTVYFGRGAYGIQAAAEAYFGVTVDRLNLAQGAVLAALIKDPWGFDPAVDPSAARYRYRWIVSSMVSLGWAGARDLAAAYPVVADQSPAAQALAGPLGLVVDAVEGELAAHGVSRQALRTAGLRVVTTLDPTAERSAIDRTTAMLAEQPFGIHAALVAEDPATGGVLAYYGGALGSGYFDDAAAPRPPASTFKPIVLAEALRQGISAQSRWDGSSPRSFPDRYGVPLVNHNGLQCPDCTLAQSMVLSLNTPYYALAQRVGPARVRVLADALGVPARYGSTPTLVDLKGDPAPGRTRADIAIGRYPVAPADMASVYATLADGGLRTDRHFVATVDGAGARRWYAASVAPRRVVGAAVAADVTSVLQGVVAATAPVPGHPAAGKTGTQQYLNTADVQDAWMAGYTPQLAAVVWLGRPRPSPIRDVAGRPIEGEGLPATLWRQFLSDTLAGQSARPLPAPAHLGRTDAGDVRRPAVSPPRTASPAAPASPGRTPPSAPGPSRPSSPGPKSPPAGGKRTRGPGPVSSPAGQLARSGP